MSQYNFNTNTLEILNILITSLYTHKDIFIRELVSNSHDAIVKL